MNGIYSPHKKSVHEVLSLGVSLLLAIKARQGSKLLNNRMGCRCIETPENSCDIAILSRAFGTRHMRYGWWWMRPNFYGKHYTDGIMSAMASQITSLTIVGSTVSSCADQRKHQSCASLVAGKFPAQRASNAERKCFHLMTSSWGAEGRIAKKVPERNWKHIAWLILYSINKLVQT